MGIDLRPNGGWKLVREGAGAWQLRYSPYDGKVLLVCQSDERGEPTLYGLRDLLNREFGTPSMLDRVRLRISAALTRWSRRIHPDFWPEGRHGLHRPEPSGSWVDSRPSRRGAPT